MPARITPSSTNATGLAASDEHGEERKAAAPPAWRAHSASSASAMPSANGKAPERTIPAHTTAKERFDQRAAGPHSRAATTPKASAAVATLATASSLIPNSAASG